jgi:hypothetical protein
MREVKKGEELFAGDGERLLFTEEFAERAGVSKDTLRGYHSAARKQRRDGQRTRFPKQDETVRRITVKKNGQPLTAATPVWRESKVNAYLANRLGPGGRPRSELTSEPG